MTQLTKLKELAQAATPGPWEFHFETGLEPAIYGFIEGVPVYLPHREADFWYMSAANPAAVLSLIERIETMRKALEFYATQQHYSWDGDDENEPENPSGEHIGIKCAGGEGSEHTFEDGWTAREALKACEGESK